MLAALSRLKAHCANIGLTLRIRLTDGFGRVLSKDKCALLLIGGAASTVDVRVAAGNKLMLPPLLLSGLLPVLLPPLLLSGMLGTGTAASIVAVKAAAGIVASSTDWPAIGTAASTVDAEMIVLSDKQDQQSRCP